MKKNMLQKAMPLALAAVFAAPVFTPAEGGYFAPVVSTANAQAAAPVEMEKKLAIGTVTVYDFGKIKLHAYNTADSMSDEFYALESKNGLVLLESGAFKENVAEFNDYIKSLKKNLKGQLLSYHPNGYTVYDSKAPVYATEGALASWGEKGSIRGLTDSFVKVYGADKVAADLPESAQIVKMGDTVTIAGIDFKILYTPDAEGNYSVEIPAINAVYRHMMGGHVHNILPSLAYIDAEIAAMKDYQAKNYDLILTSHCVPEGQAAVAEKITYLEKVKEIAKVSKTKEEFMDSVKKSFPDYQGEYYLGMTAGMLFR